MLLIVVASGFPPPTTYRFDRTYIYLSNHPSVYLSIELFINIRRDYSKLYVHT